MVFRIPHNRFLANRIPDLLFKLLKSAYKHLVSLIYVYNAQKLHLGHNFKNTHIVLHQSFLYQRTIHFLFIHVFGYDTLSFVKARHLSSVVANFFCCMRKGLYISHTQKTKELKIEM